MADFTLEAEDIDLLGVTGYRRENNAIASGGSLLSLRGNGGNEVGSATFSFSGDAGIYDIVLGTFDESDGSARFELSNNGNLLGQVVLDQDPGGIGIAADTQVERTIASGVAIAAGDTFTLTGFEEGGEHARFDFIRFVEVGASQATLNLSFDSDSISENGGIATATLTRTGDLTSAVTVTLESSDPTAATVPITVEIPVGQDSVQFQVTGVDDDAVDGTQTSTISAAAVGLTGASADIDVTDDDVETPSGDAIQIEAEDIADTTRFRRSTGNFASRVASGEGLLNLGGGGQDEFGTASFTFDSDGVFDIVLGVFDENDGEASFSIAQNGTALGSIVLDQDLGGAGFSDSTRVERTIATNVTIASGDSFTLTGFEDGGDRANFDFIRFVPVGTTPTPSLSLIIDADSISENGGIATATLTRTGDLTSALTVALESSDTTAATVPATVEIPTGQDSVQFQVTGVDDDAVDGTQTSTISANAAGFTGASDDIDVTDDDIVQSTLSLAIDADSISENGGIATATVTRTGDLSSVLTVTLDSSDPTAATVPTTVEFQTGQDSIQFQVSGVDDDDVDGTQTSTISARADGFADAIDTIDVTDDDVETPSGDVIQIEAEDIADTTRFRRRTGNFASRVASGEGLLNLGGGPQNEVGTASFTFDSNGVFDIVLGVFDENDGEASFSITQNGAALSSIVLDQDLGDAGFGDDNRVERTIATNVSIASGDSFTLTGFEDGGDRANFDFIRFVRVGAATPSLSLAIDADSISENGGVATATLTRTGDLTSALTVTLESSDITAATVPTTIEFQAGQDTVQFDVTGVDDADVDGTQTSTISAAADGFAVASDTIDVLDDDVPPGGDVILIEAEDIADTTRLRRRSGNSAIRFASGGEFLSLGGGGQDETGTTTFTFNSDGVFNIVLGVFDENDGEASFSLTQNGDDVGVVILDQDLGGAGINAATRTERLIATSVSIAAGDSFTLTAFEDAGDQANLDFIRFEEVGDLPDTAPTFLTPASVEALENQTLVVDLNALDVNGDSEANGSLTYSLTGGADLALFTLNSSTGVLRFTDPQDFENPGDSNGNNIFDVDVTVTDSTGLSTEQTLAVRLANFNESEPLSDLPVFLGDDGDLIIEAESAELNGDFEPFELDGRELLLYAGPPRFGRADPAQELQYRFRLDESGEYSIATFGARNNSIIEDFENDRGNDIFIAIENAVTGEVILEPTDITTFFGSANLDLRFGTTFSIDGELSRARVNLEAGIEYQFSVFGRDTGFALDRITLSNDGFLRDANSPQSEIQSEDDFNVLDAVVLEAEDAAISGDFRVEGIDIASSSQVLGLTDGGAAEQGSATFGFNETPGLYDVVLGVFDENDGISNFVVSLNDAETNTTTQLGTVQLNANLGSSVADEATAALRTVATGISLTAGDTITVTGTEDNGEPALLDFLQLTPSSI